MLPEATIEARTVLRHPCRAHLAAKGADIAPVSDVGQADHEADVAHCMEMQVERKVKGVQRKRGKSVTEV